ncbi:hypothetical protein MKW92_028235 [Papaver armeniacum]|nr:hypothetical protein MKW92_028235 [Papaver armeniacum]
MAIEYDGEIYQLVNAEDDVESNTIPDEADQCLDALLSGAVDMNFPACLLTYLFFSRSQLYFDRTKLLSSYLLLWAEQENERAESKKRFEKCSERSFYCFADLVRKIFDWVEHKAAEVMHKKNQEEDLDCFNFRRTQLWRYTDSSLKALKIAGKRKPHNNLVKIASTILEKKLDAEDEKVKRALMYVLENFDGNWREGSSRR